MYSNGAFRTTFGGKVKLHANSTHHKVFAYSLLFGIRADYVGDIAVCRSTLGANMNLVGKKELII